MTVETSAAEAAEAAQRDGAVLTGPAHATGTRHRGYILLMLTLVYVVNYLDRQILGILLPYIQKEFTLTDFEGGLLSGTVFAVIYATLGIPLATLADRWSRRNIIAASLATFSLMTVLSGYATQFWQLLVTRFCTGIGEAGTGPSINSMIADLYPPEKRAGALAFYSAGLNVGLLFGFFGGSWVLEHYGWRNAFIASGAPGLVLTLILLATVREPRRGAVEQIEDAGEVPSLWTTTRHLWSLPAMRWITAGCGLAAFGGYANLAWVPKFLIVTHHMTPIQVGIALSLLTGVFGAIGTYVSGVIADRLARKNVNWYMYVPAIATLIAIPAGPFFFLSQSTAVALSAAVLPSLMGATYLGPSYAMAQGMVPLRMRAQTIGLLLFALNMFALGLGPATIGEISDLLKPALGTDSLRYALMFNMITASLGVLCYLRATRTLKADLARGGGGVTAAA
ncbi:MAG TPA: MFS transporter [Rhizomicrobium sp.]|nr:MFS transporter [Rhizomicrobium sp.]